MYEVLYHVWEYTDKRKRQLRMVTKKAISVHDRALIPAVWKSQPGANEWAKRNTKHGFRVFLCGCGPGVGMGDHRG